MYIRFIHDSVFSLFLCSIDCCSKCSSNANVYHSLCAENILSHLKKNSKLQKFNFSNGSKKFCWTLTISGTSLAKFSAGLIFVRVYVCLSAMLAAMLRDKNIERWCRILLCMHDDGTKYQNLIYRLLYFTQRGEKFNIKIPHEWSQQSTLSQSNTRHRFTIWILLWRFCYMILQYSKPSDYTIFSSTFICEWCDFYFCFGFVNQTWGKRLQ